MRERAKGKSRYTSAVVAAAMVAACALGGASTVAFGDVMVGPATSTTVEESTTSTTVEQQTTSTSTQTDATSDTGSSSSSSQADSASTGAESSSSTSEASSSSSASEASSSSSSTTVAQPVTKYTLDNVTLYKKASASSKKLETVAVATKVSELSATNGWSKVTVGGKTGYIKTSSLTTSKSKAAAAKKAMTPVTKYTLKDVTLYQKASTSSKKLKTVEVATKVSALPSKTTWSKVTVGKTTGYIKTSALTTSKSKATSAKKKIVAARKAAAKKRWMKPSTAKKAGKWTYKKSGSVKYKYAYQYKDGTYPTGITKIGSTIYYFKDQKGHLSRSSSVRRVVKVGEKYYHVNGSSIVQKGWDVINDSLYDFAGKYHAALQNKTRSGITLSSSGKAVMNLDASVKKKCIVLLRSITNRNYAKSVQLRAAWNYTVGGGFYYSHILVNPWNTSWAKRYANQMLTLKGGSCYGFAAVFAALANEIGYTDVRVVWGNVTNGNPHSAVKINGLWYDPEEQYNGYIYGIYGKGGNPSNFASYSSRLYRSFDGSGPDTGVTSAYHTSQQYSAVYKSGKYYGYKGTKASLTGIYKIGGKLYKFNKKHYMTSASYKKLNAAAAEKQPWTNLRKLLGKPKKSYTAVSCYGQGKDVVYQYAHVSVSCFKPDDGGTVIVESVSAR